MNKTSDFLVHYHDKLKYNKLLKEKKLNWILNVRLASTTDCW